MKTYVYQAANICDYRNKNQTSLMYGRDPFFTTSIPFKRVLDQGHSNDWLYYKGSGDIYDLTNPPFESNLSFSNEYYSKFTSQTFQDAWKENVKHNVKEYGFDGVFVDVMVDYKIYSNYETKVANPVNRYTWECQDFMSNVYTDLKDNGVDIIGNGYGRHRRSGEGQVLYNPFWNPQDPTDASYFTQTDNYCYAADPYFPNSYKENRPEIIPNGHFEESAFFRCDPSFDTNNFDSEYWLACIDDMDAVNEWNTLTGTDAISSRDKVYEHMCVWGNNINVEGIGGWFQFGMASYLLGQNDWTTVSWGLDTTATNPNDKKISDIELNRVLNLINALGEPVNARQLVGTNNCFLYREYENGYVVVNGNSTGNSLIFQRNESLKEENGTVRDANYVFSVAPNTGRLLRKVQP